MQYGMKPNKRNLCVPLCETGGTVTLLWICTKLSRNMPVRKSPYKESTAAFPGVDYPAPL